MIASIPTERLQASVKWLKDNYSHIWNHALLSNDEKAGFLAACCDSRRCCLATLSLRDRINVIAVGLVVDKENS